MDLHRFTSNGKFLMLALDHRQSFKKLMNPQNPDAVADEDVIKLKKEIIDSIKDQISGLLIDETFGLKAYQNHQKPFLLPLEKTGYKDQAGERVTELEYSVEQIKSLGASGAKLLLYFNPNLESVQAQLETAKKVMKDCQNNNFPFFLEIVTYLSKPGLSGQFQTGFVGSNLQKVGLVIESVGSFYEVKILPDVWKLEYPGNSEACWEITNIVGSTPWILLTGGDDFETFKAHLQEAVKMGAKGFLAGRALWQEACSLQGKEKQNFLSMVLPQRFRALAEVCKNV